MMTGEYMGNWRVKVNVKVYIYRYSPGIRLDRLRKITKDIQDRRTKYPDTGLQLHYPPEVRRSCPYTMKAYGGVDV
jgi:hypothetical protein